MDKDGFADFDDAAGQYRGFRKEIESKYPEVVNLLKDDGAAEKRQPAVIEKPKPAEVSPPSFSFGSTTTKPAATVSTTVAVPAIPTPPTFTFGGSSSTTAAPAPAFGGFSFGQSGSSEPPKFGGFGASTTIPTFGAAPAASTSNAATEVADEEGGDDDNVMEDQEPPTDPEKFKKGEGEGPLPCKRSLMGNST